MLQTADFDPYYKWLGIPPQHQPPDHYRLLGLESFEPDADVIQAAAERQMAHVQSYKIGPQSDLSQKLLNEIARAKVCLLNPSSKAEYDRTLRQRIAPPLLATPPVPHNAGVLQVPREDPLHLPVALSPAIRPAAKRRRHRNRDVGIAVIVGCIGILMAAVGGIFLITSGDSAPQSKPMKSSGRGAEKDRNAVKPTADREAQSQQGPKSASLGTESPVSPDKKDSHAEHQPQAPPEHRIPDETLNHGPAKGDFPEIPLPSGREINEQILSLSSREIAELFQFSGDTSIFVFLDENKAATGLFTFQKTKEFNGPAVIVYPNGKARIALTYKAHLRNGALRCWDPNGELLLFSEYNHLGKFGLTCFCEGGRPVLIEEWDSGQKPHVYLVEYLDSSTRLIHAADASEGQSKQLDDATKSLRDREAQLFVDEGKWKKSFRFWYEKNDSKIKQIQIGLNKADGDKKRAELKKQLNEAWEQIKLESDEGRARVLRELRP